MRYVLAVIFICALGAPAASAMPAPSPDRVAASKADFLTQASKRSRPRVHRQSRGGRGGGIHPLVGSGDY